MIKTQKGDILRNLEEQVQYLTDYHKANQGIAQWGIRVIGQVETVVELDEVDTSNLQYGDTYAVGTEAPYDFYIWTRSSVVSESGYWFPFGEISIVGPQGPMGRDGCPGPAGHSTQWYVFTNESQITPNPRPGFSYSAGDMGIYMGPNTSLLGEVYYLKEFESESKQWVRSGSIRGPQGMIGNTGPAPQIGSDGAYITSTDPKTGITTNIVSLESLKGRPGDKGDVGGFINIAGQLTNESQLPTPSSLGNLTIAYLVNDDLYIQIGQTSETATWNNMGPLNVATLVTVGGQYQNVWDADTKLDKVTTTSGYSRAYVVKPDGSQGTLTVSSNATPDTIALRSVNGIISVGTPYRSEHAANKGYVDTEVDKCVKKVAADDFTRVYGVNSNTSDGAQTTFIASQDTLDDSVAIRVTGGQLNVSEPTSTSHAATKGYVDTALENKVLYYHTITGTATYSKAGASTPTYTGSITLCFFSPIAKFTSFSDLASWVATKFGTGFSGLAYGVPYGFINNGIYIDAMYANSTTTLGCTGQVLTTAGVQPTLGTLIISSIASFTDTAIQIL